MVTIAITALETEIGLAPLHLSVLQHLISVLIPRTSTDDSEQAAAQLLVTAATPLVETDVLIQYPVQAVDVVAFLVASNGSLQLELTASVQT